MSDSNFGNYVKAQYLKCIAIVLDQCSDLVQARAYAKQMTLSLIDRDVLELIDIWETTDVTLEKRK